MKKGLLLVCLITSIFLINLVSASSCSPSSLSFQSGQSTTQTISCVGGGTDINNTISITKVGDYFSINANSINSTQQKTITITFTPPTTIGNFFGAIIFGDNLTVPITLNILQQSTTGCEIDIFPLSLQNLKVQQGSTKTRNIQLTVPICYPSYINFQSAVLQTDEKPIQLGEISLGRIQPGNYISIPIEIDATNEVTVGTYSDVLSFLLYNSTGSKVVVPTVSISATITSGISPLSNFSNLADLPTCSLDAVELSINSTGKMTCSVPNPNIQIRPLINTKYIKGISVQETSSQYIYTFQPIAVGTSSIIAEFLYKNAPIGNEFNQEIRIRYSTGSLISGTEMSFSFYQSGSKVDKSNLLSADTTVLVIDNKSNSIIPSFTLYLNGNLINNTFSLESDKTYELRASSYGYVDAVVTITTQRSQLALIFDPIKDSYEITDSINVTTSPLGGTILLDNYVVTSPITILTPGVHSIKGVKSGYTDAVINITIRDTVNVLAFTPEKMEDWGIGKTIVLKLSKNATWIVDLDGTQITTGTSDIVKFKMEKIGRYEVKAGDGTVMSKTIEKKGLFDWWQPYHWWIVGVLGAFLFWLLFLRGSGGEPKQSQGFTFDLGKKE